MTRIYYIPLGIILKETKSYSENSFFQKRKLVVLLGSYLVFDKKILFVITYGNHT